MNLKHTDIQDSIRVARHKVLDRMLLATTIFGGLTAGLTIWRDMTLGVDVFNSVINFGLLTAIIVVLILRHKASILIKGLVLFSVFAIVAVKSFLILGPLSNWMIFLSISCVIIAVTASIRNSVIIAAILSLSLPVAAFLYLNGYVVIRIDADSLNYELAWVVNIWLSYFLCAFVIILGVGQLQKELGNKIGELKSTVGKLQQINKELKEQIRMKVEYQDQLEITSNKYKALFENSRDAVILLKEDTEIVEVNQVVFEYTGYTKEDLIGKKTFDVIAREHHEYHAARISELLEGQYTQPIESVILRKDGSKMPVEFNSTLINTDEKVFILSSVRDLSYRKKVENEKLNAVIEAEEKERERFAKDLHDDLGPVFSTVKLYHQALLKGEKDPERRQTTRKVMEIVDNAVKQLRNIAHDMSPYLLRDEGLTAALSAHMSDINSSQQIRAAFLFRPVEGLRFPLNIELTFYRIYLELINNTIKHSKAKEALIGIEKNGNEAHFHFIDDGIGFDPDDIENNSGKGIGVRNIRSRVSALKGSVEFWRKDGKMNTIINIPL